MRLAGALVAALALAPLVSVEGVALRSGLVHSSMPSAVIATSLATAFDAEPAVVTTTAFVTTPPPSSLTLTPLFWWLRTG